MSELFDEEGDLIVQDPFLPEDKVTVDASDVTILDARRRLEMMLEEKRLRDELDDFSEY